MSILLRANLSFPTIKLSPDPNYDSARTGKLFPIAQCQRRTRGRMRPGDQPNRCDPQPQMAHAIGRAQVSTLAQKNGNAAVKVGTSGEESTPNPTAASQNPATCPTFAFGLPNRWTSRRRWKTGLPHRHICGKHPRTEKTTFGLRHLRASIASATSP